MQVNFKTPRWFFDKKLVQDIIGRQSAAALSKFGAFVQRRARSSIRRRKKASAPGSPPSCHASSEPSLKTIWFAFDRSTFSVVAGPVGFNRKSYSVPSILEFGGSVPLTLKDRLRLWYVFNEKSRQVKSRRGKKQKQTVRMSQIGRVARYPARPFMGPALAAEAPNFPGTFTNTGLFGKTG